MKGKLFKKALAVATSVLMLSCGVPIQSLSQVFEDIAITASAEENVSSSKGSSTYVEMPQTGFREYTIPDGTTTFNVYDYTGQGTGYAPRNDSYLLLTAPYGYAMKVSGYVNFSTGGEVPAYLRIFNGGTTDSEIIGNYKGRTNVNEEGNSNQLLLYFYNNKYDISDYSDESGVYLTVDLVPLYAEQAVINMPKSGNKTVNISSETKTIKVYDDGGINGNYTQACNGSLTLTAPENYLFRLSGSIDTEKFLTALYVYDGSSDDGYALLSRQYGNKTLQTVMSSGQSITLTFSTGQMNGAKPGLNLNAEKPGLDLTVDLVPVYTVSVEGNIAGGKVTLDKESAMEGETVTLKAIPDVGYFVKSVSVNDTAIAPVGGVYSFTMPAENVTVSVEFEKQRFTVTWNNEDGTALETDEEVPYGSTPEYNGEIPTKPMDDDYTYTFSGWSPALSSVEGDIVYTAQFTATARRGDCGANATWCFDPDTGTLTIFGEGDMDDYEYEYDGDTETVNSPWYVYKDDITSVEIKTGITYIGISAFDSCQNIESITIPENVTSIGNYAFFDCTSLESITIPDSVESIGIRAFAGCTGLTSITIPDSVESIGDSAFFNCTNIKDVYCYANPANLSWNEDGCDDFIETPKHTTVCHVPKKDLETYEENFGNVNVRFVGDVDMGLGEHLYGHSITLDGSIGVNFYVELTDALLASETAEMVFTVPNGSETDTQTLLVKDVIADDNNKVSVGGKTYYKFKCNVSAKDMASEITAQMFDGDKAGTEYKYSVKDYADYLLSHTQSNAEYAKAAPLVKAMLDYGSYAQNYFDHNTDALANGGTDSTEIQEKVNADTINKPYEPDYTFLEDAGDTTFEGATLSLRSETTLSLYFKSSTDLSFECYPYEIEKSTTADGYQIARIRGIKAADLDETFRLDIYDAAESGSILTFDGFVHYCPLTYCYNVLNGGSDDENLKNVCRALYLYWLAANDYSE